MTGKVFRPASRFLAIEPHALSIMWDAWIEPQNRYENGIGIVSIRGPLSHHPGECGDSYDAILGRVAEALADARCTSALVLDVDSPGGAVAGMLEAGASIRSACAARGLPLVAYVNECAASAAYALACVASEVVVPASGIVGSIGTMAELVDASGADAAMGVRVYPIAVGARKLDSNAHTPKDGEAIGAMTAHVETLAQAFFAHVAAHRGLDAERVRALEAGLFVGANAVSAGLATSVESLSSLVARLSGAASNAPAGAAGASMGEAPKGTNMEENEKAARAALQAIMDDEKAPDEAKAKAAAALKAMDGDEEAPPKEKPETESKALARLDALEARIAADIRQRDVAALLSARTDLSTEQRATFATLDPVALKAVLDVTPRSAARPAASATVAHTIGSAAPVMSSDPMLRAVHAIMGGAPKDSPIKVEPHKVVFGALSREDARTIRNAGGAQ